MNQESPTGQPRVRIFDTTLRDGEQSPGCSMMPGEKLCIARALARIGVDIIEAGFPIASDGDFEGVRSIARGVEGATIAALARCTRADIERAGEAVEDAASARIHVFLATSAIHREHKLGMAKEEIIRRTREGVALARELCEDVEFSPEDASRTEPDFLVEVVEAAIEAGATTVNIPDTVGYALPEEYGAIFEMLHSCVRGIDRAVLSAHCHDDLGLATANTLAAVGAGARQVECTINGIGERAGNAALEEIVMALRTRHDAGGFATGIDTTGLFRLSRLVEAATGSTVPPNKAIVGANAFRHESGIHQHGVIAHRETYEIMKAADVGRDERNLVLGKHSGTHAVRRRLEEIGCEIDEGAMPGIVARIKAVADRKKDVADEDVRAIAMGFDPDANGPWRCTRLIASGGSDPMQTSSIALAHEDGRTVCEAGVGDGPVEATLSAVARATGVQLDMIDYELRSVAAGGDAQGEARVLIVCDGVRQRGHGVSTDIVEASAQAIVECVNRSIVTGGTRGAKGSEEAGEAAMGGAR